MSVRITIRVLVLLYHDEQPREGGLCLRHQICEYKSRGFTEQCPVEARSWIGLNRTRDEEVVEQYGAAELGSEVGCRCCDSGLCRDEQQRNQEELDDSHQHRVLFESEFARAQW